jgi:hypothetical protein
MASNCVHRVIKVLPKLEEFDREVLERSLRDAEASSFLVLEVEVDVVLESTFLSGALWAV